MRKALLCLMVIGLLATALSACAGPAAQDNPPERVFAAIAPTDGSLAPPVRIPDPQRAVTEVYRALENSSAARIACALQLDEIFGLAPHMIIEAVAYRSCVAAGLSDVTIVKPAPGMADKVREALIEYRSARAASFRNYDIRGSYSIASGAVVFEQGDHVVMLMLPDNDLAREILEQYLPG